MLRCVGNKFGEIGETWITGNKILVFSGEIFEYKLVSQYGNKYYLVSNSNGVKAGIYPNDFKKYFTTDEQLIIKRINERDRKINEILGIRLNKC